MWYSVNDVDVDGHDAGAHDGADVAVCYVLLRAVTDVVWQSLIFPW